ncbi:hypothetical protein FF38_00824 [Lucilia cuprina]|uniref:Uncharacterized protein n=1 Tax=Lucilia cuprina TaxID=7375 RepID=A0A0L0CF99_LUCCU|nr:hypothetical protein FF38_00824 [Lucilia cuprina]
MLVSREGERFTSFKQSFNKAERVSSEMKEKKKLVEEETLKNVVPHSVATALANIVLPVPGGPTIRTPRQGLRIPLKKSGIIMGKTTASCSIDLASFKPATSVHLTPGCR